MSKHTPGPWRVIGAGWDERGDAQYTLRDVKAIGAADARLIAAAPDLLAALKRVLSDDEVALSRPDYEFARAAILKAEGEGLAHLRSTAMMGAG